jgi:hypothetical protein
MNVLGNKVYCNFSSDTQKMVLGIVSEIRYTTKLFYQKTTTHALAPLDCIQQPNWAIKKYSIVMFFIGLY